MYTHTDVFSKINFKSIRPFFASIHVFSFQTSILSMQFTLNAAHVLRAAFRCVPAAELSSPWSGTDLIFPLLLRQMWSDLKKPAVAGLFATWTQRVSNIEPCESWLESQTWFSFCLRFNKGDTSELLTFTILPNKINLILDTKRGSKGWRKSQKIRQWHIWL